MLWLWSEHPVLQGKEKLDAIWDIVDRHATVVVAAAAANGKSVCEGTCKELDNDEDNNIEILGHDDGNGKLSDNEVYCHTCEERFFVSALNFTAANVPICPVCAGYVDRD